ncbi:MAG: hypothetical protein NZ703_04940 [Gemmataceae bacterium]|nr:hypothetical protein [Gemmataceae bacterium]
MAVFYVVPPRPCLEETLVQVVQRFLPGLPTPEGIWDMLVEQLMRTAQWPTDVYLVPRDELPEDLPVPIALRELYGAEPGDEVIEVPWHTGSCRRWMIPAASSTSSAPSVPAML